MTGDASWISFLVPKGGQNLRLGDILYIPTERTFQQVSTLSTLTKTILRISGTIFLPAVFLLMLRCFSSLKWNLGASKIRYRVANVLEMKQYQYVPRAHPIQFAPEIAPFKVSSEIPKDFIDTLNPLKKESSGIIPKNDEVTFPQLSNHIHQVTDIHEAKKILAILETKKYKSLIWACDTEVAEIDVSDPISKYF
jgi:hypothetical protein